MALKCRGVCCGRERCRACCQDGAHCWCQCRRCRLLRAALCTHLLAAAHLRSNLFLSFNPSCWAAPPLGCMRLAVFSATAFVGLGRRLASVRLVCFDSLVLGCQRQCKCRHRRRRRAAGPSSPPTLRRRAWCGSSWTPSTTSSTPACRRARARGAVGVPMVCGGADGLWECTAAGAGHPPRAAAEGLAGQRRQRLVPPLPLRMWCRRHSTALPPAQPSNAPADLTMCSCSPFPSRRLWTRAS